MSDVPARMKLRRFYEEEATKTDHQLSMYSLARRTELWWHRKRLALVTNFLCDSLVASPASTFLDIGCAEGHYLRIAATLREDLRCVGVDISQAYVRKAKQVNPQADFAVCDADSLPFRSKSFGVVLCSEVLEHTEHPRSVLSEILRVTEGSAVLSFPGHSILYKMISAFPKLRSSLDKQFTLPVGHISDVKVGLVKTFLREHYQGAILELKFGGALPHQFYRVVYPSSIVDKIDEALSVLLVRSGLEELTTIRVIRIIIGDGSVAV